MANMTSNTLSFALDEVVGAAFFDAMLRDVMFVPALYNIKPSAKRRERTASFGSLGEWSQKLPTVIGESDNITQQFEKTYNHTPYSKVLTVERELVDDSEFSLMAEFGEAVGESGAFTMENHGAELFRDAFAGATHTAEDGLSICNSAHLNVDSGNSQSNSGSSALSMASIKTTVAAMRNFQNYRGGGIPEGVRPDALLVPHDIEEDAFEITASLQRPDDATNAQNFWQGKFKVFSWDLLSTNQSDGDADNWFMLDTKKMMRSLIWYMRVPPEVFGDGNLFTGTKRIGAYMRYSYGVRDWKWVYGHAV